MDGEIWILYVTAYYSTFDDFFFSNVGKFKKYSWRLGCTKMEGSPDLAHGLSSLISKYTFLEFKNPNPYFQQKSKYEHKLIHTYNF